MRMTEGLSIPGRMCSEEQLLQIHISHRKCAGRSFELPAIDHRCSNFDLPCRAPLASRGGERRAADHRSHRRAVPRPSRGPAARCANALTEAVGYSWRNAHRGRGSGRSGSDRVLDYSGKTKTTPTLLNSKFRMFDAGYLRVCSRC